MTAEDSGRKRTILLIEDYDDSRALLATILRGAGYDVVEAATGREGVEQASNRRPDLIVMDLAMPELDGVQAIRLIRQMPEHASTPIFVTSAFMTDEVKVDIINAGSAVMFDKPFDPHELLDKIKIRLSE